MKYIGSCKYSHSSFLLYLLASGTKPPKSNPEGIGISRKIPPKNLRSQYRLEDRQEEREVGKTPSQKDREDPSPSDLGMAVQLGHQDEDQIIIEKPQTHSVKSYFIQTSLSKHELLGPREKNTSEGQSNAIHTQIEPQIRQN